jgi:hypothetical protein
MSKEPQTKSPSPPQKGFSLQQVAWIIIGSMAIAIVATVISIKVFLFPSPFTPVTLSPNEEKELTAKIEQFEHPSPQKSESKQDVGTNSTMIPEEYSEAGDSRQILFTERELNAILANNTDLADKVALDLAQDLVSIKMLIPMDPDLPLLGGKMLKIRAGAELAYKDGKPVIKLRGVSLMGIPMPNAWLGGLKNIDLIKEFGSDEGFWKVFSDGVRSISVVEGSLKIELKE